ncbi:MAG: type II toxin-antitoxin system death-on-curing family toxin [Nevskiaceae bacterium]|nr:MAG: type II toxin-antitoxin system death-on-curing family toxin [Nevskiaceae bacterium]TBR73539.1 MAG: type II toxin-antitoxin system death-on-curing family toxin [Nevskiaceae bacterium]
MTTWIGKPLILAMHDYQLAEHGSSSGVRDEGLLESALARPRQLYAYGDPSPDLAALAATLVYGLARNHAFVDGNKRIAAAACETMIELNGACLHATDGELLPIYIALADGSLSEEDFARWLRMHIRVNGNLHEPSQAYAPSTRRRA